MEHCHSEIAVWIIQIITFAMGILLGFMLGKNDDNKSSKEG